MVPAFVPIVNAAVSEMVLISSRPELWLYVDVLRRAGKHTDALAVLAGPLGRLCPMPDERVRMAAEATAAAGSHADTAALCQAYLEKLGYALILQRFLLDCGALVSFVCLCSFSF